MLINGQTFEYSQNCGREKHNLQKWSKAIPHFHISNPFNLLAHTTIHKKFQVIKICCKHFQESLFHLESIFKC